jgi:hypothetical protein
LLRRLPEEFEAQLGLPNGAGTDPSRAALSRLEQTLSNVIQLAPQKGLLAEDMDAELDRLYHDHVEPPRARRGLDDLATRNAIRMRANQVFRSAGIWPRLNRHVRISEYTYAGDPLRIDYTYRRNGTTGFVQALPLGREPGQAKVLAFTADAIRTKLPHSEFIAVTETAPRPENPRHQFIAGLLEQREIPVVPITSLAEWARTLAPALRQPENN